MTLQSRIMRLLDKAGVDKRLGKGQNYFPEAIRATYRDSPPPAAQEISATLWGPVARGLVYIDFSQSAPENWQWRLTAAGQLSARDEHFNPDDPEEFLKRLAVSSSDAPLISLYMREALICYVNRAYLASAVMLGVASEAAILNLVSVAAPWLGPHGKKLVEVALKHGRTPIGPLLDIFRRALEPHKPLLPDDLCDGLTLTMDSLADAIRVTRNDSGHPSGRTLDREDQYIALQMSGRYFGKIAALTGFLNDSKSPRPT